MPAFAMDTEALRAVRDLLRQDDYAALQFVPFAAHTQKYSAEHLEHLLEEEKALLSSVARREPVLYTYSLNPAHYAQRLSHRQQLLGDLFLYGRPIARATVMHELPEYHELALRLCEGEDDIRCPFRLVPVFDALFLADPIDSDDDTHVFLHNDSVQMARYLRQAALGGKAVADVGTGSGILAFTAWQGGAARVVAADINPRALQYAGLNFALNDCANISLCEGSIERVVQQADVIVSNPPYMQGRSALSLAGGGDHGLDTALRFARIAKEHHRRMIMILEIEQAGDDDDPFLGALGVAPVVHRVLRKRAGFELKVYEFDG